MAEPLPAPGSAPSRWDLSPRRKNLLVLFLLFLATVPMLTKIFTSDFGTHLALGRHIVQNLSINDPEFLNYTSLGLSNFNHEWGFQAILYLVYSAGGVYGVSFLCWVVVFGIYLLLHRSMTLRGADPYLSVFALFAFSGFLRIRIQPRPEIFTYLFIAMTIYLFSEYFFGNRRKLVYLYPLLMLVWGNIHGSYLIGLALGGIFFLDALLRAAWRREFQWEKLRGWVYPPVAVGLLGLAACGLNPLGYDVLLAPLHLLSRGGGQSSVLMSISELTPVKGTGLYIYYKAAALFAALALLLGILCRRVYLLDLLLFSIAFKGAWGSARAVSMMGLFLSPGVSLHLTGFSGKVKEWFAPKMTTKRHDPVRDRERKKKKKGKKEAMVPERPADPPRKTVPWGSGVALAVIIVAVVSFGIVTLSFSFSQLEYGIGMTEHKFSFAATEFLKKNPIRGNMFNFFDIGGFLDWQLYPQVLTFIDGRAINPEIFRDHQIVTGAAQGWKDILQKHKVTYIVTKSMDSSGMILPLIPVLSSDPEWNLVFADGLFLVFVWNTPENHEYVQKLRVSKMVIPRHVIAEAYHYMYLGVSPVVAYQTISNMYMVLGDRAAAIRALKEGIDVKDTPFLRNQLMRLEKGSVRP